MASVLTATHNPAVPGRRATKPRSAGNPHVGHYSLNHILIFQEEEHGIYSQESR